MSPFSLLLPSTPVVGNFTGHIPPSSGHSDSSHRHGEKRQWLEDTQDSCPGYSPCASATHVCPAHLLCVLYNCITSPRSFDFPLGSAVGVPGKRSQADMFVIHSISPHPGCLAPASLRDVRPQSHSSAAPSPVGGPSPTNPASTDSSHISPSCLLGLILVPGASPFHVRFLTLATLL